MSLINRMLQDLDARRATGERASLPHEVRTLPETRQLLRARIAVGMVVAGGLVVGAIILWANTPETVQQTSAPAPVIAASSPAQIPAPVQMPVAPAQIALPPTSKEVSSDLAKSGDLPVQGTREEARPALPAVEAQRTVATGREGQKTQAQSATGSQKMASGKEASLKVATSLTFPGDIREKEGTAARQVSGAGKTEDAGPPLVEKKVRSSSPRERADSEYRRAIGAMNQGRLSEALTGLRAALEYDASHVSARLTLATLLAEQNRIEDAQGILVEGLLHSPGQLQLSTRLARVQVDRGNLRGAAETLQKAMTEGAGNAEYRALNAAVLQRLGRHKEAAEEYQSAVRLSPQSSVWWMGLGISLEADGRNSEAREAFQRARSGGMLSSDLDRYVEQKLRQLQ